MFVCGYRYQYETELAEMVNNSATCTPTKPKITPHNPPQNLNSLDYMALNLPSLIITLTSLNSPQLITSSPSLPLHVDITFSIAYPKTLQISLMQTISLSLS